MKLLVEKIKRAIPAKASASVGMTQAPPTVSARPGLGPGQVESGGAGKWIALFAIGAIAILAALYY